MNPSQAPYFFAVAYAGIVPLESSDSKPFRRAVHGLVSGWNRVRDCAMVLAAGAGIACPLLAEGGMAVASQESFAVSEGHDQLRMALYGNTSLGHYCHRLCEVATT